MLSLWTIIFILAQDAGPNWLALRIFSYANIHKFIAQMFWGKTLPRLFPVHCKWYSVLHMVIKSFCGLNTVLLSRKWFVTNTHRYYHYCFRIHCLGFVNVNQMSLNLNGRNYFHIKEFNDTSLLYMNLYVRYYFVKQLLSHYLQQGKIWNYGLLADDWISGAIPLLSASKQLPYKWMNKTGESKK